MGGILFRVIVLLHDDVSPNYIGRVSLPLASSRSSLSMTLLSPCVTNKLVCFGSLSSSSPRFSFSVTLVEVNIDFVVFSCKIKIFILNNYALQFHNKVGKV